MSFRTDIHPLRNDRIRFLNALLARLDREWREVTPVGWGTRRPGGRRSEIRGGTVVVNTAPTDVDRLRVRAVLRAWKRDVSDRYLDLQLVQNFARRRSAGIRPSFDEIRRNWPQGCVKFVFDELNRHRPELIGPRLSDVWSLDAYFSQILHWDDRHCYGLLRELIRQQGLTAVGGGAGVHPVWQAARNWLFENHDRGVYRIHGLRRQSPTW